MNPSPRRSFSLSLALISLCALSACAPSAKQRRAEQQQKRKVELEALKHYKLGIDAYTDDRYAEAEQHWKEVLVLDPNYPNAQEYVRRAEAMQKAIKKLNKHGKKVPREALPSLGGPIEMSGTAAGLSPTVK